MRNRNISDAQFAPIAPAAQGAADTVASEVGSARVYPPHPEAVEGMENDWYVEEGVQNDETFEGEPATRGMSMGMSNYSGGPVDPGTISTGFYARGGGGLPHEMTAEWAEDYEDLDYANPNQMASEKAGRLAARDRFQYDTPEWKRRNLRVVR